MSKTKKCLKHSNFIGSFDKMRYLRSFQLDIFGHAYMILLYQVYIEQRVPYSSINFNPSTFEIWIFSTTCEDVSKK